MISCFSQPQTLDRVHSHLQHLTARRPGQTVSSFDLENKSAESITRGMDRLAPSIDDSLVAFAAWGGNAEQETTSFNGDPNPYWEVERICAHRIADDGITAEYKVAWKGYTDTTWEVLRLLAASCLILQFCSHWRI